ncbi:unnamed protein product [Mytilus coruscus]|uniref:Uncharacterized protein n=1 Tax=Mytilus coruscus TaxID=42192 RepID=A0A6J8CYN5_MYTCO|nr:unnamed protein product [Mytilus coruscus]
MTDSGLRTLSIDSYYMQPLARSELQNPTETSPFEELSNAIEKSKVFVRNSYETSRRRATEVMVWVLANKNRNSYQEISCSMPVASGLNDYRLGGNAMRQATDFVLKECTDCGLNILNFSMDGQWIQLMNRDTSGKALSIFQLQKDVWNSSKSMSKQELLKRLVHIFDSNQDRGISVKRLSSGALSVSIEGEVIVTIRTPVNQTILNKGHRGDCVDENVDDTSRSRRTDWIPDSVINNLTENSDSDLLRDVDKISNEISDICLADNANEASTKETQFENANQTDFEHAIEVESEDLNKIIEKDTSGDSETTNDIEQQRHTTTHIELAGEFLNKLISWLKQNAKTASK